MAPPTTIEECVTRELGTGAPLGRDKLRDARPRTLPRPSRLEQPLTVLRGAGQRTLGRARALGIETIGDLIEHLPMRYEDRPAERLVGELAIGEEATVSVEVRSCRLRPTRRRNLRLLECEVADSTGPVKAVWFNQDYLAEQLAPGTRLLLKGELAARRGGSTFKVREHEIVGRRNGTPAGLHTLGIVPVYPATEGLPTRRIRDLAWQAQVEGQNAVDPLPACVRVAESLPGRRDALAAVHFPEREIDADLGRRRLAFEELLLMQLAVGSRRRRRRELGHAPSLGARGDKVEAWLAGGLPFRLTGDQERAIAAIDGDLASERPMQRLLVGEVGSGKTVIALYAMLRAAEAGCQGALMAPTETLAEQHFRTIDALTGGIERIGLLTKATTPAQRRTLLEQLSTGELSIVVGTHALLEDDVAFAKLAVAVVDEQHRFGVGQRLALDRKGPGDLKPHVLHMSATPIPRTLALTTYGDLDATTLRELPAERRPVKTWAVSEEKRSSGYEFIRERLREGRQCYVVCPLVEESEALQAKAATVEAERLAATEFGDFQVAVLHGQMPSNEKQAVMKRFAGGEVDVLVATSVIEVGIDVANASVMVIEAAERYGLSQLHQLRGRVGRGGHESYCLLYGDPRNEVAHRRLDAIAEIGDGFKLAEIDLALRGEGEIIGNRQSGLPQFKFAELPADFELLMRARECAAELLAEDPALANPEHALLGDAVRERFGVAEDEPIPA